MIKILLFCFLFFSINGQVNEQSNASHQPFAVSKLFSPKKIGYCLLGGGVSISLLYALYRYYYATNLDNTNENPVNRDDQEDHDEKNKIVTTHNDQKKISTEELVEDHKFQTKLEIVANELRDKNLNDVIKNCIEDANNINKTVEYLFAIFNNEQLRKKMYDDYNKRDWVYQFKLHKLHDFSQKIIQENAWKEYLEPQEFFDLLYHVLYFLNGSANERNFLGNDFVSSIVGFFVSHVKYLCNENNLSTILSLCLKTSQYPSREEIFCYLDYGTNNFLCDNPKGGLSDWLHLNRTLCIQVIDRMPSCIPFLEQSNDFKKILLFEYYINRTYA